LTGSSSAGASVAGAVLVLAVDAVLDVLEESEHAAKNSVNSIASTNRMDKLFFIFGSLLIHIYILALA
jgi:hypothetical protein